MFTNKPYLFFDDDTIPNDSMEGSRKASKLRQGKLEKSMLNFKANNPDWRPTQTGEKYLETINEALGSSKLGSNNANMNNTQELNSIYASRMRKDNLTPQESVAEVNRFFFRTTIQPPSGSKML